MSIETGSSFASTGISPSHLTIARWAGRLALMFECVRRASLLWRGRLVQAAAVLLLATPRSGQAQSLYDASLGTIPEAQGWTYGALGLGIGVSLSGTSVRLDTTTLVQNQAGWSRILVPPLDRKLGFTLLFTAQLNAEAHNNANRAGFSVIALGSDTNGIELAFWTNTVFAQEGPPSLFVHAEDVAFTTTGGFVDYALTLAGSQYSLYANGTPILAGPIRDYTSFSGLINPYRTPNFVFFGDDTTSANASVNVRRLVLIRPPLLTISAPGVVSWSGSSNLSYRVQASSNLVTWADRDLVTSPKDTFSYTNTATETPTFLRVVYP